MAKIDTSSKNKKYGFKDYFHCIVLTDMELYTFFGKLNKAGKNIDEVEVEECIKEFIKIGDSYIEKEKEYFALKEAVERTGIKLSDKRKSTVYNRVVLTKENGFANNGKYDHTYISFPILFDGIEITKEMISSEDNPFLREYEKRIEKNKKLNAEAETIRKELAVKESKLKKAIFSKSKIKNEILSLNSRLSRIEELINEDKDIETRKEFFDKLTSEQRKAISEYLGKIEECKEICAEIKRINKNYIEIGIKGSGKKLNNVKWEKAFKLMIDNKEITQMELEKINDKIIEAYSRMDEIESKLSNYGTIGTDMSSAIDWYFTTFIQPKTIKNNTDTPKIIK